MIERQNLPKTLILSNLISSCPFYFLAVKQYWCITISEFFYFLFRGKMLELTEAILVIGQTIVLIDWQNSEEGRRRTPTMNRWQAPPTWGKR